MTDKHKKQHLPEKRRQEIRYTTILKEIGCRIPFVNDISFGASTTIIDGRYNATCSIGQKVNLLIKICHFFLCCDFVSHFDYNWVYCAALSVNILYRNVSIQLLWLENFETVSFRFCMKWILLLCCTMRRSTHFLPLQCAQQCVYDFIVYFFFKNPSKQWKSKCMSLLRLYNLLYLWRLLETDRV